MEAAAAGATARLKDLGASATSAGAGVEKLSTAADKAGGEISELSKAVDEKTRAIKVGLQVEQSEIELQRQHLVAAQAEQQARLQAAQARGMRQLRPERKTRCARLSQTSWHWWPAPSEQRRQP